jgi:hypothetical protein
MRFHQPALGRLDIAARHRREIHAEPLRQLSLRRQPVADGETAGLHVLRDGVGDGEVARHVAEGQIGRPGQHRAGPRRQIRE